MLFCVNMAFSQSEPEIVINYVPLIGQNGHVEGNIVWNKLTSANAGQYAVIAMLHAIWEGGGGYYVKPYDNNYLNSIDTYGNFSILITTGGIDAEVDEVIFYFVERKNINNTNITSPSAMAGKYLATKTIYRSSWVNPPESPVSNIRPGFVKAGTEVKLSCETGGSIRYTLDGSNPITSSTTKSYNNNVFKVQDSGALLIKAVVKVSDKYSSVSSFLWLPEEPLNTAFWGLNVSLALNGEYFGYKLSEEVTRERMLPIAKLTKWVRSFGTINNGNEYINKIAKELGLHTMIGVYITNNEADNKAQIDGLKQILQTGPTPDLISVGNETSLLEVSPAILASSIDEIREILLKQKLLIPIGTVDIASTSWSQSILDKLDFIGVNIYSGIWDNTPESQMLSVMKQTYANTLSAFPSTLVILTEVGAPYNGGTYSVSGGTQTASVEKATNYLCGTLDWIHKNSIPAFYFEAYDEAIKSMNGGHPIEQYFGVMDANMQIHPFYKNCIDNYINNIEKLLSIDLKLYPNPFSGVLFLEGADGCTLKIFSESDILLYSKKIVNNNETLNLEYLPAGVYFFNFEKDGNAKTLKMIRK